MAHGSGFGTDDSDRPSGAALAKATLLAMLGFDFFLHGGLLAGLYATPSPFLLPPERAFALISLGYLAFLLLAAFLVWLLARLRLRSGGTPRFFGLRLGLLAWGALALGLASIATVGWRLLLAWFLGQTVELIQAGLVAGSSLARERQRPLVVAVLLLVLVAVAATMAMQNLGLAPAPELRKPDHPHPAHLRTKKDGPMAEPVLLLAAIVALFSQRQEYAVSDRVG